MLNDYENNKVQEHVTKSIPRFGRECRHVGYKPSYDKSNKDKLFKYH